MPNSDPLLNGTPQPMNSLENKHDFKVLELISSGSQWRNSTETQPEHLAWTTTGQLQQNHCSRILNNLRTTERPGHLLYKQWGRGDKILKTINVPTNTDMTFKKSVKQSPPILIVERAVLPWNDADEWKDKCWGLMAAPSWLQRDQNFNEFLDTSGWSLFYLQAKYFFNWQQLGIYNRGIETKKKFFKERNTKIKD